VHDEDSGWNNIIRNLHRKTPLSAQFDFTATPRFQKGGILPWTICDCPLKQAIVDGIVKRPVKGIAKIQEAKSEIASVRYKAYLNAGVERWKECREQLKPLKKKPILFVMMNSTDDADDVQDWLKTKVPGGLCRRENPSHPHRQIGRSEQERFGRCAEGCTGS
jgi:type III restriction enzyme